MRNLTNQNGSKARPHENEFPLFSNTKINITNRVEKVNEKKNEVICLVFKFPSWVMALNLSRKVHFLQFYADFSKKPKSVKAIYIFHLKVLTTLIQKMKWFIGIWATPYEILAIEISKNMLTQQKFNKIIWFRVLTSPKTVVIA